MTDIAEKNKKVKQRDFWGRNKSGFANIKWNRRNDFDLKLGNIRPR